MIEATVSLAIAMVSGLGFLVSRGNQRILELDKRIDTVELKVAEKYVPREELATVVDKLEAHLIRMEQKLDNLMTSYK